MPMKRNLCNILDNCIDVDSSFGFDKMLIPNRIYKFLIEKIKTVDNPLITKNLDYLFYIINTVYRRYQISFNICAKLHWDIDVSIWAVPLSSKIYNRLLGSNYKYYINLLIEWGVLGRNDSYVKGDGDKVKGRCKRFWFTEEFLSYTHTYLVSKAQEEQGEIKKRVGGVRNIQVTHKGLYKRLALHAEDVKNEQLSLPMMHEIYADLQHFHIDEEKSVQVLDTLLKEGKIDENKKLSELHKVKQFNNMYDDPYALYCKRDAYGRVHTNITQMKKEVRKNCMLCDGKPTVGIDIKSSQGAFLYKVLDSYVSYFKNQEHIVNLYSTCDTRVLKPFWNVSNPGLTRKVLNQLDFELGCFKLLLKSGSLYEFFLDRLNSDFMSETNRNEVKKEFLTCLFCGKYYSKHKHRLVENIRNIWRKEFNYLYKSIEIIKRGNHAALAHDLQRTESNLVFNIVYNRVKNEIGCPLCTVHDSIIVEEKYADQVKKIFDESLNTCEVPTFTEVEYMEFNEQHWFENV